MKRHRLITVLLIAAIGKTLGLTAINQFKFPWSLTGGFASSPNSTSEITEQQIELPHGISVQILSSVPNSKRAKRPPLLFLHGSFLAAWCWTEKFFPFFVQLGYPVVALSWRGTGGTFAGGGVKKVKVAEHCEDLQGVLDQLPNILGKAYTKEKPVLISHSFGGIVVMKFLEQSRSKPSALFSGIVSMCSVPPSGIGKMTMRFLRRSLRDTWKVTAGFSMKKCINDGALCRDLFFGGAPVISEVDGVSVVDNFGVTDEDLERYQGYFARDTDATIDLLDLARHLPSRKVDADGKAPFVDDLPPCLVIGVTDDFIVDKEGNLETARYFGLKEPIFVDSPHDVMLGRKWQNCADAIHAWIQESI